MLFHLRRCLGLLFLISALFVACNSGGEADTKQIACDGTVSQVQDLVAGIVNDVPGFAGCAPDPGNAGGYIVNTTSSDVDMEAVRTAIISHESSSAELLRNAELRPVLLDVSRSGDWFREVPQRLLSELPAEHKPQWQWFSADLDELHDQVLLGYGDKDARAWAQQFILDNVDAPPGVIVAFLGDPGQED